MVVCKKKGCHKLAQWPSTFCRHHYLAEDPPPVEVIARPPPKSTKKSDKTQTGFLGQYLFEDEDVMRRIEGIVEEEMSQVTVDTGYRAFANIQTTIAPLLELIVQKAGEVTSFPL